MYFEDICRSTFERHMFNDTDELMSICESLYNDIVEQFGTGPVWTKESEKYVRYGAINKAILDSTAFSMLTTELLTQEGSGDLERGIQEFVKSLTATRYIRRSLVGMYRPFRKIKQFIFIL